MVATSTPLLPRENPQATDPREIRHYVRIYADLIAFKVDVLQRARRLHNGLSAEAREAAASDVTALEEQLAGLRERLDYWQRRLWEVSGVDVDPETRTAQYNGKRIDLTRREFELMKFMLGRPNEFTRPRQLVVAAWGEQRLSEEQLRTYVGRLRKKFLELGAPAEIANHRRLGYAIRLGGESQEA